MKYIIILILFLFINNIAFAQQSFVWADDQDYEPYIYLNAQKEVHGIFHEVMRATFARMNIPLTNQLYPWKRAQKLVEEGHADGMITIPTKERLTYLVASNPIMHVEMRVHYNKLNVKRTLIAKIKTISEMRPYSLIDYQGDGWAESHLAEYDISWAPNYTSAVWMIAADRADIFLDDPISIKYHINKQISIEPVLGNKLLLIEQGDFPLFSAPYCLLVNKDSPYAALIKQFNIALKEIKTSGEYERIINKYLN